MVYQHFKISNKTMLCCVRVHLYSMLEASPSGLRNKSSNYPTWKVKPNFNDMSFEEGGRSVEAWLGEWKHLLIIPREKVLSLRSGREKSLQRKIFQSSKLTFLLCLEFSGFPKVYIVSRPKISMLEEPAVIKISV